jgi:hypothetical protein
LEPQRWLFEARPINEAIFGWQLPGFWAGPSMALVTIIIFGIWTYLGYNEANAILADQLTQMEND